MSQGVQTIQFSQSNTTNSKANQLRLNLPIPYLCTNSEVALSNLFIYYSWRNITSTYGNNTCSYTFNSVVYPVTFPNGNYSYDDMTGYLRLVMFQNGHYLINENGEYVYYISLLTNSVYYSCTITTTVIPASLPSGWTNPAGISLSGTTPTFNITNTSFGTLIGFNTIASYPTTPQTSTKQFNSIVIPQISPVTSINVNSNMVNNSRFNVRNGQSIYSFSPNVGYASQIIIQPNELFWYRAIDQNYSYIELTFTDQTGADLQVLDTNIVASLVIRPLQK